MAFYLIPGLVHLSMCHKPSSFLFSIPSGCTSFHSFMASSSHTLAFGSFLKFSMDSDVLYFPLTPVCAVPTPWSDSPLEDPSSTTFSCHIIPYIYIYYTVFFLFVVLFYLKNQGSRFLCLSKFLALIGIISQQTVISHHPTVLSDSNMK